MSVVVPIDLTDQRAFVTGVGDDQGFGWAIAKALCAAGAEVILGVWPPVFNLFQKSWSMGKFDASRTLPNGSLFEYAQLYPIDLSVETAQDIPEEIASHKRYRPFQGYTVQEVAASVQNDFGQIDLFVHAVANAPEVKRPLLETSQKGYLAALSASSYSLVSSAQYFGPITRKGGSFLALSYLAADRAIPGYGGGMSSAKAALESDTRTLAFEMGRRYGIRINAISAGAYGSRAAKAIGFIEEMIEYGYQNAPLQKGLSGEEVAHAALFLMSDWASAITGTTLFVDNGLHAMGIAPDSRSLTPLAIGERTAVLQEDPK